MVCRAIHSRTNAHLYSIQFPIIIIIIFVVSLPLRSIATPSYIVFVFIYIYYAQFIKKTYNITYQSHLVRRRMPRTIRDRFYCAQSQRMRNSPPRVNRAMDDEFKKLPNQRTTRKTLLYEMKIHTSLCTALKKYARWRF